MKVTLITGASSGIGEAFARRLARENHNLVLVARSEERLSAICDELMSKHDITAHYIAIDLNDYKADKRLFKETSHHGLEVNWLINNAGFGSMGDFVQLELENELEMISLNVMALVAITQRYLRSMRENSGGTIINVSSAASFQPIPYMATYSASKAFVTSFSEAIAEENRAYGIRIMALCPGPTETRFFDAAEIDSPLNLKGMQSPEEVVEAALSGIKRGKINVVSGWTNYFGAKLGTFTPNRLVTKVVGKMIRSNLAKTENKKQIEDN